jgi:hypothetical protein
MAKFSNRNKSAVAKSRIVVVKSEGVCKRLN